MASLLRHRWRTQPSSSTVQLDWSHPLARRLIYAQLPGAARRGFFRLSDPQISSSNFGPGLSNGIFSYSEEAAKNGRGIKGRSTMTNTAGATSGSLVLVPSTSGGNPVYTYAGVFERSVLDTTQTSIATFAINGGSALTTVTQNSGSSVSTFSTRFVDAGSNTEIFSAAVTNLIVDKGLNVAFSVYENGLEPVGIFNNTQLTLNNNANFDGVSTNFGANYINATGTYVGLAMFFWARTLSAAESRSFTENPWQLFKPQKQVLYSLPPIVFSYSRPASDGPFLDWASTGVNHYSQVNGTNPNQTTTYNYATFPAAEDWYIFDAVTLPAAGTNIQLNFVCSDMGSPVGAKVKITLYEQTSISVYVVIHEETVTVTNAIQTLTVTPAEWAVVATWPWSPRFVITAL